MRLGAILPTSEPNDRPLRADSVANGARRLERLGFASVWAYDAIGRGVIVPDPLMAVAVAATATDRVEVGTGVLQVPLRRPVELAHRVLTAQLMSGGRLLLGVGAGSTRADFDAVGVDHAGRFEALEEGLALMRALWGGARVGDADLTPWPATVGGPPVLIAAWWNGRWIRHAATDADGWLASAGRTSLRRLSEGIRAFRDLGGTRAVVTNIRVDLSARTEPLVDDAPFQLACSPAVATERLHALAELGFDDAVVLSDDHREETLATVRELLPVTH